MGAAVAIDAPLLTAPAIGMGDRSRSLTSVGIDAPIEAAAFVGGSRRRRGGGRRDLDHCATATLRALARERVRRGALVAASWASNRDAHPDLHLIEDHPFPTFARAWNHLARYFRMHSGFQ